MQKPDAVQPSDEPGTRDVHWLRKTFLQTIFETFPINRIRKFYHRMARGNNISKQRLNKYPCTVAVSSLFVIIIFKLALFQLIHQSNQCCSIGLEKEEREKESTFPQKMVPFRIRLLHNRPIYHTAEAFSLIFKHLNTFS